MFRPTLRSLAPILILVLAGCGASTEASRAEASDLARQYLAAAQDGDPDHGWSLIFPNQQAAWNGYENYATLARDADWSQFQFEVVGTGVCDDGSCVVCLVIPGGESSVPEFLRSADNKGLDGIVFSDDAACPAMIPVAFSGGLFGSEGVVIAPHD